MGKKKEITSKEIDNQLNSWRIQANKEIPEKVGLAFYTNDKGETDVEVYMADDDMWMSQQIMSILFGVEENTITYHIGEIYKTNELDNDSTTRKIRVVRQEGKREVNREIQFYNLDMVISVGYRVNSIKATQFRKFATRILHEYIQKTDIFALSSDYDKTSKITKEFFAFIQNKLHYAIAGMTAAEIIHSRADSKKDNMGLTSWQHAPNGKIYKTDVTVAKNYLQEKEIHTLRLMVTSFLDLAQMRAERQLPTTMQDWIGFMSNYLEMNDFPTLN